MTQREKLTQAIMLAQHVKSIASAIERDAESYDEKWPLHHTRDLTYIANEFLKLV